MRFITLEQLRATADAGGVTGVTLKGQGGGFFVEIATRSGQDAVLTKARSKEPRRFGNPTSALVILRDLGLAKAELDVTNWDPSQKDMTRSRQSRSAALRDAHEAAAYNSWLAAEIVDSLEDERPSVPHEEVMARMGSRIQQIKTATVRDK